MARPKGQLEQMRPDTWRIRISWMSKGKRRSKSKTVYGTREKAEEALAMFHKTRPRTKRKSRTGPSKPNYVYVFRVGNYFKVGFSTDVEQRLQAVQTHNPLPVQKVFVFKGSKRKEALLHSQLKSFRAPASREWFKANRETWSILRRANRLSLLAETTQAKNARHHALAVMERIYGESV